MSAERVRNIGKRFKRWQETWSWSISSEELSHLAGRPLRHQVPGAEHQDPIGDHENSGIMGGKDHATAAQTDFPQSLDHCVRRLMVHLGRGLVGEDDVRIGCESPGHRDSLLLSE
jgi:hypothetical protein